MIAQTANAFAMLSRTILRTSPAVPENVATSFDGIENAAVAASRRAGASGTAAVPMSDLLARPCRAGAR
jgi:hypothetical protein